MIDLRSDTVTRPTAGMRQAIAAAEVGDDVFAEDPTVLRLQERVADLLGKEAALYVPSGTMANQIALMVHTRRGDEIIAGEGTHCAWYEVGAAPALAGIQFVNVGHDGLFTADEMAAAVKPDGYYFPRTSLVVVENTHNRGGGRIFPQSQLVSVAMRARELGLLVHLDGARLWNASAATGAPVAELAAPADTVSVCLSKGLGAPVGSLLAGGRDMMRAAHRFRKMLGGGMRQVGILAAAGLYALDHHRARLVEDHANARAFAARVAEAPALHVLPPETNMVMIDVPGDPRERPAERFAARLRDEGVLLSVFGPARLRAVTHLDVSADEALRAAGVVVRLAGA